MPSARDHVLFLIYTKNCKKAISRALRLGPFFRDGLCFYSFCCCCFFLGGGGVGGYFFLLGFNFINLILYTTNFNPTINKDIIVI